MKKLMYKLSALTVAGVIMMGVGGCEKHGEVMSGWHCWVFVTTTESPVLLLAKSIPDVNEGFAIFEDFKSQYGKNNVIWDASVPLHKNPDGTYAPVIDPESSPDCYEIMMTLEFPDTPPVKDLFAYGFRAVKTNGNTAVCKCYDWAYTEEDAKDRLLWRESQYDSYTGDGSGGMIVSVTKQNLGSEIYNMPITF